MLSSTSEGGAESSRPDRGVPPPNRSEATATYLGLLAGRVRLRLLRALAERPGSVTGLSRRLRASVPLVSHNLRRMQEAGLVRGESHGRKRIYALDNRVAVGRDQQLQVRVDLGGGWQIQLCVPAAPPEVPAHPVTLPPPAKRLLEVSAAQTSLNRRQSHSTAPPGGAQPDAQTQV
ncbi:MAG: winged helix-turn-helix domain-containing protein [Phycisphaerales bacterium]|nr:winged helix-turn-helix domain-containing protein [Phycisphaerales bacterium]